jgi:ABC-type transporter Mla maintaining outer membrane lipid asymmetry ATPase subunit MlaF
MVFQGAALFDSMTVFENVAYPLREHTQMDEDEIEERVKEKLEFVDLDAERVMEQFPSSSREACANASVSRAAWRTTPRSCSTTSRRRVWIRSRRARLRV